MTAVVLGMDLSLSCPAFCIARVREGKVEVIHLSHVKTKAKDNHGTRLRMIFNHLEKLLVENPNITHVVREKGFSRHAITTQTLFKVVGISDLVANHFGYDSVAEIAPTTVKKLVAGSGRAEKEEVAEGISKYLYTPVNFSNTDESDACGVCIAYMIEKKMLN